MKKTTNNIADLYKECFEYLGRIKKYLLIIFSIFFAFVLIGYFFPSWFEKPVNNVLLDITNKTKEFNFLEMFFYIINNNLMSSIMGFVFGIFIGIFPVAIAITNGYILGYVLNKAIAAEGIISIAKLLPHGIFELPAVFIALAMGLNIGTAIFREKKRNFFFYHLEKALKVILTIVVPLLILAGTIETLLIFSMK